MLKRINRHRLLDLLTILLLLGLPYYLFEGKLYIGGDDTRLFYSYPFDFLKNVAYFSWYNVSSVGINVSNQYILPFLSIWSVVDVLIKNKIIISYLAFSLPLILGFLFFKKFVGELFDLKNTYRFELCLGSLCYILSPIIIFDQLFIFLTTVWLLGLVPAVGYFYLKYLKSSSFIYIYISTIICFILSFALWSVPWLLGFILPLLGGSVVLAFLSKRKEILFVIKRTIIFSSFIILTQTFWLLGFLAPYVVQDKNSFAVKFISKAFVDTFAPSINATATGFIIYPLLNLFHRQIAFDFDWKLKNDFINLYDKTFFLNLIFIFVIIIGLFYYKKNLKRNNRRIFLFILASFVLSLYFFTVNIGPLKDLFLSFGNIPGFVMFRNFYDKFAPGYVFLYSILITISLVIAKKKYPNRNNLINYFVFFVIILNFSIVKSTVNSPLWTTENVYKTLNIPKEYMNFMGTIRREISPTNNIFSLPFGISLYSVIKDESSNNAYVGISPVKIFSGVNDISGSLSFNFTVEADVIDKIIIDKKYDKLNKILYDHNINYVLVTKNIPDQILRSYIFNKQVVEAQDERFVSAITDEKILTSQNGNYELYTTKKKNSILSSRNLYFKKINSVKYLLYIKNLTNPQELKFNDSFQNDWKLYLIRNPGLDFCKVLATSADTNTTECKSEFIFFEHNEMSYLWTKPIFDTSHTTINGSFNTWTIDSEYVKKNFSKDYYTVNKDGSINIEMVLYFRPQLYLYYGLIISFTVIALSTGYLMFILLRKNEKHKKKNK